MAEKETIRLKRHETFSIREGWLEKAIDNYNQTENLDQGKCFSKDNGPRILGIGSNMVKSLRYWVEACGLISFEKKGGRLTKLGEFLSKRDPYLSEYDSWWLIHMALVTNELDAPVLNSFYNMEIERFEKEQLLNSIKNDLEKKYTLGAESSLESDVNMIVKLYFADDFSNPEDNLNCPLSRLGLLGMDGKNVYVKKYPKYSSLSYKIVYLCLLNCIDSNSFNLEDLYEKKNNPLKVFNLTKSGLYQYLDEMKNAGYINLVKTAGLNTVTIKEKITLKQI